MRFAGFVRCVSLSLVAAAGCAAHRGTPAASRPSQAGPEISGVWDAVSHATIGDGAGAGDVRIEKQEWHLTQSGSLIRGYYIAALTFVSGDGRPYVCSRQPQFSTLQRFEVAGRVRDGAIEIQETGLAGAASQNRCDPGTRQLARYRGLLDGDVLTLVSGQRQTRLYRIRNPAGGEGAEIQLADAGSRQRPAGAAATAELDGDGATSSTSMPASTSPEPPVFSATTADVSGTWIWEHQGTIPGGDQKQEREEWHVTQQGSKLSGYYDRIVHQVSTDGHAYRCSMALDFQIATRYQFSGDVRGDEVRIFESSYEVLSPSACDNGKRRLDAYKGKASTDEIRLVWGVGGQVLRRPRPDVPTQRF
jgi:hypothetical protein